MKRLTMVANRLGSPIAKNKNPALTAIESARASQSVATTPARPQSPSRSRPSGHRNHPDFPKSVRKSNISASQCGSCRAPRIAGASTQNTNNQERRGGDGGANADRSPIDDKARRRAASGGTDRRLPRIRVVTRDKMLRSLIVYVVCRAHHSSPERKIAIAADLPMLILTPSTRDTVEYRRPIASAR